MKKVLLFSLISKKPKICIFGRCYFFIFFLLFFQYSFSASTLILKEDSRIICDSINDVSAFHITGGAKIIKISSNELDSIINEKTNVNEKLAKAASLKKKIHAQKKEKKSVKNYNTNSNKHILFSNEFLFEQNSQVLAVCITPVNVNTLSTILIKPLKINKCFSHTLTFSIHYKKSFLRDYYSSNFFSRPPPFQFS